MKFVFGIHMPTGTLLVSCSAHFYGCMATKLVKSLMTKTVLCK